MCERWGFRKNGSLSESEHKHAQHKTPETDKATKQQTQLCAHIHTYTFISDTHIHTHTSKAGELQCFHAGQTTEAKHRHCSPAQDSLGGIPGPGDWQ